MPKAKTLQISNETDSLPQFSQCTEIAKKIVPAMLVFRQYKSFNHQQENTERKYNKTMTKIPPQEVTVYIKLISMLKLHLIWGSRYHCGIFSSLQLVLNFPQPSMSYSSFIHQSQRCRKPASKLITVILITESTAGSWYQPETANTTTIGGGRFLML